MLIRVNPYLRILVKKQGSAKTDVLALPFIVHFYDLMTDLGLLYRDLSFLLAQSQAVVLHAVREILQIGFEREQHTLHLR